MVTIKDVAKAAGVSPATVSLALNNSDLIKMETKYKILKVAEELKYSPNKYARSLVTKETRIIGVAWMTHDENISDFSGHTDTYLTEMIASLARKIMASDYSMLFEHYHTNDPILPLPSIMNGNRVDGMLIIGGIVNDELLERIKNTNIPSVLVGSRHEGIDYVDTDPELGVFMATEHMILNGHRDIVFINSPNISQASARKLQGFCKAMNKYGLEIKKECIAHSEFSGQAAYEALHNMWEKGIRPTAIVGGYDSIAVGAIRFLYNQGLRCPEDFSATGFEDNILADHCYPPLTTIRIHKAQMGVEACRVLVNRIKKPNAQRIRLIIKPELIIRKSTRNI